MNRKALRTLAMTEAICLLPTFLLVQMGGRSAGLSSLWRYLYGGEGFTQDAGILALLMALFPSIVFPYLFADFMSDEFHTRLPYVFTRTCRRTSWLLRKTAALVGLTAAFYLVHSAAATLLAAACGAAIDVAAFSAQHLLMLLWSLWQTFLLTLLINIVSLYADPCKTAVVVLGVHIICLLLFLFLLSRRFPTAAFFLPTCQFIYAWHDAAGNTAVVQGFSVSYSSAYGVLLTGLILCPGLRAIRRIDIL